jgi:hypothetical protein
MSRKQGDLRRLGRRIYADAMAHRRQVNVHQERITVTMDGLIADASRPREGGEPAVHDGASDAMVLKDTADVGHLCQIIADRDVRP